MSPSIPLYLQRKLAHLCTRCGQAAAEDSDLCTAHLEDSRRRAREGMARSRRAKRKDRKCVDCGKASKRYRCKKCWTPPSVNKAGPSVNKTEIWRVDPGTTWNRFRGKGRRGRLTREEQAEEDKRDARWAIAEIEKFIAAIDVVMSPAVQQLGPVQRTEAKRQAAQFLGTAGRFLDELADKYSG